MAKYKYKTFVISLKSAEARRQHIMALLDGLHLEYEIVDAVYGKDIADNDPSVDRVWATNNWYWVSKGALGCSLSHKKVYDRVLELSLDYALVLEDDTVIDKKVADFLEEAGEYLAGKKDVIMLYYATRNLLRLEEKNSVALKLKNFRLLYPENPDEVTTTNAYLISAKACEGISAYQAPVKATSDMWFTFISHNALEKLRCVYPMLADAADYKSTIDYVPTHSLRGRILNFIDEHSIFPFYQLLKMLRRKRRMNTLHFELVKEK